MGASCSAVIFMQYRLPSSMEAFQPLATFHRPLVSSTVLSGGMTGVSCARLGHLPIPALMGALMGGLRSGLLTGSTNEGE